MSLAKNPVHDISSFAPEALWDTNIYRALGIFAGTTHIAFHFLFTLTVPGAIDPLSHRIAISILCLFPLWLEKTQAWFRPYFLSYGKFIIYLNNTWFIYLVWLNSFLPEYFMAYFVVVCAIGFSFSRMRDLYWYSGSTFVLLSVAFYFSEKIQFEMVPAMCSLFSVFFVAWLIVYFKIAYNKMLFLKNDEMLAKNIALEKSIEQTKLAQQQLIHQEKMASLGRLTSGIAHELQNPLNFVNNFSELITDNTKEIKEKISAVAKNADAETVAQLNEEIELLQLNSEKIKEHGKRAERIVRSMLLHTQTGTGEKEPVVINRMLATLINISKNSFEKTNPGFTCEVEFMGDEKMETLLLNQQEITHALGNILNNAFSAVKERSSGDSNYKPLVSVSTELQNNSVSILIKDNGTGIPSHLKEKIFEPFFTTKPTGQGTGLGLSIAYDIIKSHGGEIKVLSDEGNGTTFTVILPV